MKYKDAADLSDHIHERCIVCIHFWNVCRNSGGGHELYFSSFHTDGKSWNALYLAAKRGVDV